MSAAKAASYEKQIWKQRVKIIVPPNLPELLYNAISVHVVALTLNRKILQVHLQVPEHKIV